MSPLRNLVDEVEAEAEVAPGRVKGVGLVLMALVVVLLWLLGPGSLAISE